MNSSFLQPYNQERTSQCRQTKVEDSLTRIEMKQNKKNQKVDKKQLHWHFRWQRKEIKVKTCLRKGDPKKKMNVN